MNQPKTHDGWQVWDLVARLGGQMRVLSRRELAAQGGAQAGSGQNIAVTINARDAQSFRQSRVQVASDIARAVAFGRRAF